MRLVDADNLDIFFCDTVEECGEMIANEPTVDAVPVVHGRWIEPIWNPHEEFESDFTCSVCDWGGTVCVCGKEQIGRKKVNYCPNCGAKMDGGSE